MKIQIPEGLKAAIPQTFWGKIIGATPIVMTVIATMLAGLASSEMTTAQYDRSMAAQQQAKAGDQWGLFQAKRLRGSEQRNTLSLLENIVTVAPLDAPALRAVSPPDGDLHQLLDSPAGKLALACLVPGALPPLPAPPPLDPAVAAALNGADHGLPAADMAPLLAAVKPAVLDDALRAAHDHSDAVDAATAPAARAIAALERALRGRDSPALRRSFTAALLRYNAARYDAEAKLNQSIGSLLDLQVSRSNLSAERHHRRSQRFFYGMLAAQMAVIVSTFAMAARKHSLLWSLAAAAGLAAVGFASYVYLFM